MPSAATDAAHLTARRPIMALLEQLGRKGTLRILWELRDGAPQSFRALQANAGEMSPSVLNDRLKELRALHTASWPSIPRWPSWAMCSPNRAWNSSSA
jgi:DNA-binding HxlR family transcriptional regulator